MTEPTAISLEEVVMGVLLADEPLADYFTERGRVLEEAVFWPGRALDESDPADVLSANTPTPFAIVRFGGVAGDLALYSGFTVTIYDAPDNRFWELYKMVRLVIAALNRKYPAGSVAGFPQWQRIDHTYTSSGQVDPDWSLHNMFVRFQIYGL